MPTSTDTRAPDTRITHTSTGALRCESTAVVELPGGRSCDACVELVGGRHRYRVGGRFAEGFRWWYGWVTFDVDDTPVDPGTELLLRLVDGRTAMATVEHSVPTVPGRTAIRGVGAPPFDVP